MKLYIQNYCSINPSGVWVNEIDWQQLQALPIGFAPSVEPNYTSLIPAMQLRRMSKPIRIGMAASLLCLGENRTPKSIHVGTAYGNLADSEKFLKNMIVHEEQTLTPTAFIQSTHNTVSGQIALALNCNAHNMSFVHRAHSLESAFIDASLHLTATDQSYALVGAVDECTEIAYETLTKLNAVPEGIAVGEGSSFFQVSGSAELPFKAVVTRVLAFRAYDQLQAQLLIQQFVAQSGGAEATVVYGVSKSHDVEQLVSEIFPGNKRSSFKEYAGSFPTAVGFGLCMAIDLVQNQPVCWLVNNEGTYWSIWKICR